MDIIKVRQNYRDDHSMVLIEAKEKQKNALNPAMQCNPLQKIAFLTIINYSKENSMKIKNQSHKKLNKLLNRKKNKSRQINQLLRGKVINYMYIKYQ